MRHVYAAFFSGCITLLLAIIILYFDYGFWHERYSRQEIIETNNSTAHTSQVTVQSPTAMIGSFFQEAKDKLGTIRNATTSILEGLEGKDSYIRKEESTTTSQ